MTVAEMVAWNVGQELARNPGLELQLPGEPWTPGLLAMTAERLEAMERLTPAPFFAWVDRGWHAAGGSAAER